MHSIVPLFSYLFFKFLELTQAQITNGMIQIFICWCLAIKSSSQAPAIKRSYPIVQTSMLYPFARVLIAQVIQYFFWFFIFWSFPSTPIKFTSPNAISPIWVPVTTKSTLLTPCMMRGGNFPSMFMMQRPVPKRYCNTAIIKT